VAHYGQTVSSEWLLSTGYRICKCPVWCLQFQPSFSPPNYDTASKIPRQYLASTHGHPNDSWAFCLR